MMVPQFDEAQLGRMRRAYKSGVSAYDLSVRFGIGESLVLDVARGKSPPLMMAAGDPISCVDELKLARERRKAACRLHFLDLVTAYRPEVIIKFNAIQKERAEKLATSKKLASEVVEAAKNLVSSAPKKEAILDPKVTRRSLRIFDAALLRFKMTYEEMTGQTRTKPYVFARQVTMFAIYSECAKYESTTSIGCMFKKDHSTVVSAVHKIRKLIEAGDQKILDHVNALREVE